MPGLGDLAITVQAVTPDRSTVNGQLALLLSSPAAIPAAILATSYLQALEAASKTALPVAFARGLARAFSAVSRPPKSGCPWRVAPARPPSRGRH